MRKENASFITKFISEAGSYLVNSDYFAFVELKDYACYVIADGIDTDERRESAKLAVTTVITRFSENPGMSTGRLKRYMKAAHNALLDEAGEIRLEASIVILLTDYKKAMWAHVGNCRLYWMKNGNIRTLTKDTSLTQRMVDEEEVPMDQLAFHEERNNLYGYLGQPGRLMPVTSGKRTLEDGDILILMTRGVWENVGEAEIIDAVDGVSKPEEVCTGIEDVILSQRMDVIENYTIAAVFVDKVYNNPKAGKYKKWIKIGASIAAAIAMFLVTMAVMKINKNNGYLEQMDKHMLRGIEYLEERNYTAADDEFNQAYEAAESVSVRKSSKSYKGILCVELYDKLAGQLCQAKQALDEKEYKKAAGLYSSSVEICGQLEAEYGEEISGFKNGIEAYLTYAQNMQAGMAAYDGADYEAAVELFTAASQIMNEIDDTVMRNVADEYIRTSNAKKAVNDGMEYEEKGTQLFEKGIYTQALIQYKTARELYVLAQDNYGYSNAASKISIIDVKISNVESLMEKMSNQELEQEADVYLSLANQAVYDGDYNSAREYYDAAKELFRQTGNSEQVIEINNKLESLQYGPDKDAALTNMLDALESLAAGDEAAAIIFLNQAKAVYNNLGDTALANEIQKIISSIEAQEEE